jgi:hypothetical protein
VCRVPYAVSVTVKNSVRQAATWLRAEKGAVACLLALAAVYRIAVRQLVTGPIGFDESYFLWTGWSVNHGLVPYRDFVEYKPVVVFFINALALKLFGLERHGYRIAFIILTAGAFLALAGSLLRRGTDRVLTFCLVCSVELALLYRNLHDSSLNDTETVGMSFFLLGVAALLWTGPRIKLANIVGGICLALAVLSKEPFAFISLTAWIAIGAWTRADAGLDWRRYARWTIVGAASTVAVVLAYVALTGSVPYYVSMMREYLGYCARIGCKQPASLRERLPIAWGQIRGRLMTPELLGGFVPFMVAFAVLPRVTMGARLGIVAAVLGSFYAVSIGGCYFRHYFLMGLAGPFLWGCLGAIALSQAMAEAPRPMVLWIRVSLIAGLIVLFNPRLGAEAAVTSKKTEAVDLMGLSPEIIDFVKKNTAPTDYVFTDGMPSLFLLTDRLRPTRDEVFLDELIDSYPGSTDVEKLSRIRAQLVARKPKVVYLDDGHLARKRRTRAALLMPFLTEFGYRQVMPHVYFRP